jgi:hypothetical protein
MNAGRALAVWFLLLVAAVVNGVFRERVLVPRMGSQAGHVLSTVILCVLILALTWLTISWIGPPAAKTAVAIGGCWLLLTLAFEFGFGHYGAGKPWSELLMDYDVLHGRVWILVLITTAAAPWLAGRLRGPWT